MPSKFKEMLERELGEAELRMIDVRNPESVQIEVKGNRLWVHINGQTVLRVQSSHGALPLTLSTDTPIATS